MKSAIAADQQERANMTKSNDEVLAEWERIKQFSHRSREWWTYDRQKYRSPFGRDGKPVPVSDQLRDHASANEIATTIAAVAKLWRDMGEQVKAANRASPLSHFTLTALRALPRDQQEQVLAGERLKGDRSRVREVLQDLKAGRVPRLSFHPRDPYFTGVAGRLVLEIYNRHDTAYRAAIQRDHDNWKPPPVDDAAWEQTLKQRAEGLAYQVAEVQVRRKLGLTGYLSRHDIIKPHQQRLLAAHGERFADAVQRLLHCQCEHCRRGFKWSPYCREETRIRDEFAAQLNEVPGAENG